MQINIIQRNLNDILVFDIDGNLALEGNAYFRKCVSTVIDAGTRNLIINMEKVSYMDSSGLGELISCHTKLQKLSGRLGLLHLNERIRYLLVITKLVSVFEVFDSESVAVATLSLK